MRRKGPSSFFDKSLHIILEMIGISVKGNDKEGNTRKYILHYT